MSEGSAKTQRKKSLGGPNLILSISLSEVEVDVNPVMYSDGEISRIKEIIGHMKDHVYIDKTYVSYKGTRWKTAFIVEDKWYRFCKLILDTEFGNKAGDKINDFILGVLQTLSEIYLYHVLVLFGYNPEHIELRFPDKCEIVSDYELDERTRWDS